jgi:hypothetical protein
VGKFTSIQEFQLLPLTDAAAVTEQVPLSKAAFGH